MSQWIGQAVSVQCHEIGDFQGLVAAVDSDTSTVTLKNVFKNGKPCEQRSISLLSSQIKNLTFVESSPGIQQIDRYAKVESSDDDRASARKKTEKMKPAKVIRAKTVSQAEAPPDRDARRRRSNSFTGTESASYNNHNQGHNSPRRSDQPGRHSKQRQHFGGQSDCFSVPVESCMGDFDFEKNLAKFDKKKVFNEIESDPKSRLTPKKDKYNHDEMVIKPNTARQIKVDAFTTDLQQLSYTTDNGLVIPCISYVTRQHLFDKAVTYGFTEQRRVDMVGRNTSDMVFQLIGGSNRLSPQNNHQRPTIIVLCGPHVQGSYGLNCARHLANHNIKSVVFTPLHPSANTSPAFQQELALYDLCGCKRILNPSELPTSAIDLIINCLDSNDLLNLSLEPWYKYITNWCNTSRAHVLAIDPLASGCVMDTKWSVHIALPQHLPRSAGQTYLCDISLPRDVFTHIGIKYRSPFGIKFCIPLYNE